MGKNGQSHQVWRSTEVRIKPEEPHWLFWESTTGQEQEEPSISNFLKVVWFFWELRKHERKKERTRKTMHPSTSSQIMSLRITRREVWGHICWHTLTVHSLNEIPGLGILLITVLVWINDLVSMLFGVLVCGREVRNRWSSKSLPKSSYDSSFTLTSLNLLELTLVLFSKFLSCLIFP